MSKNNGNKQLPILYFFDDFPEDYLGRDGIPAALQSAETAILLIAMGRWPAITGLIWQACELFLRAKYTNPGETYRNKNLPNGKQLQERFFQHSNILTESLNNKATNLRALRNQVIHEGYSPKFDDTCIDLFLMPEYPILVR